MKIKRKIKKHFEKNWHIWGLAIVCLLALIIRLWNFEDNFYFRLDQSRDAKLAKAAYENGLSELPLLGPRAAGTYLRLGPIFYYFQYLSAVISDSVEPFVMAYPIVLFSVLSIVLFYYFLRQFFSKKVSFIVATLFAFSFLLIQYSRFAWNPNLIPFWGILFFLGLYKSSVTEDKKKAGWWLVATALAYAVASQLHFILLLVLPLIAGAFWVFYRPKKIKIYFWVGAFAVIGLLYSPMLFSEFKTSWNNFEQFKYALTNKSKERPLAKKLEKSAELHGKYFSLSLTSYGNDKDRFFIVIFVGALLFFVLRAALAWKKEKDPEKRAFLLLTLIWLFAFAGLYTQLAYTVKKPRFWLITSPIPFIFLAAFFKWIFSLGFKKKLKKIIVYGIAFFILAGNLYATGYWYWTMKNQKEGKVYTRDLQLKEDNYIGLKQMREAAQLMNDRALEEGKSVCLYTNKDFIRAYDYLFAVYHPETSYKRIHFGSDKNEACVFFAVKHGKKRKEIYIPKDHREKFLELNRVEVARRLVVSEIKKKSEEEVQRIEEKWQEKRRIEKEAEAAKEAEESEDEEEIDEEEEKPDREERVFWKDVFGGEEEEREEEEK